VYAGDNVGAFPCVVAPARVGEYTPVSGPYAPVVGTKTTPSDALTEMQQASFAGSRGNVLSCMWVLVLTNQMAPKGFVCKSDPFATGGSPLMPAGSGTYYASFESQQNVSYSIPYPWVFGSGMSSGVAGGWWKDNTDASQPIVSDMAPMNGTGSPVRDTSAVGMSAKAANSGNHGGDGQNVGYGDGHCEWQRTPLCGASFSGDPDNIFTSKPGGPGTAGEGLSANGAVRLPRQDASPFDVIMVPVRNLNTGGF